jgi:hypothetical protein
MNRPDWLHVHRAARRARNDLIASHAGDAARGLAALGRRVLAMTSSALRRVRPAARARRAASARA